MPIIPSDLTSIVVLAIIVAGSGIRFAHKVWPFIRPAALLLRDTVVRDLLRRVDKLERRVDIIEAIQSHGGGERGSDT